MYEEIFAELPDGICLSNAEGTVLYLNRAAEKLLSMTVLQARGRTLCESLCGHLAADGAAECASRCDLLKPGGEAKAVTFRGKHGPQETLAWRDLNIRRITSWKDLRVRCLKAPEALAGKGGHLTIIEDAAAELELERQKEDWRQMIAHDLRSPLTNIYAAICLVQEAGGKPLPEGCGPLVDAAERACRKMLELITLSLEVAKLDAGAASVKRARVGLAEAARAELAEQEAAARAKKLGIEVSIPAGLTAAADPDLFSRVVQNVLDNAVKFTPLGGVVKLSGRAEGRLAVLTVKDSGPGIPAEEAPLLFDRYHQAAARREGKLRGTGLGLSFCRKALELMGGEIAVNPASKDGAEFEIRLPLWTEAAR